MINEGDEQMSEIFPSVIQELPKADIPLEGITAYLSQGENHQILFMEFDEDVILPEHEHEGQYAIVLRGKIELTIDNVKKTFIQGNKYYIPAGVRHYGKIFAGYADITFFNQKNRYSTKK